MYQKRGKHICQTTNIKFPQINYEFLSRKKIDSIFF